jgi:uncharacterized protein involved in exopolysaccharide biosynthesis
MSGAHSAAADIDVDLRQLFASLARNWFRIVVITLVVTGMAFAFAWLATPQYKATAKLNLDKRPEFDEALKASALSRLLILVGLKSDPFDVPADERVLKAMRE